ncbi:hypothetical protein HIM_12235 [Hirsutella minnesotensis 3608]|uniref:Zn(2)-C6 fungal-type domain-containing protein n=1 Tax=Hirsutella minnesotensis 3608 TaxID=1043627 RepID=A0A0F7ZI95_9HYPO|nr:hypothetical protein HIM_12235 [Hirsutella minnesotensis 3608]
MERRYPPLRPLAPAAESDNEVITSNNLEYKRRRVGVAVACNSCRRRKIRCDGQRPVCANCREQSAHCEYRDESPMSEDSKKLVVEVVRALGNLSVRDLFQTVSKIKDETEATTILSTLKAGSANHEKPSSAPTSDRSKGAFEKLELAAYNPVAYPLLTPFDSERASSAREDGIATATRPSLQLSNEHTPRRALSAHELVFSSFELCDSRLKRLDICRWTSVDISNATAAKCISLYLETDHPLLGHFSSELFISDLTSGRDGYCSSLLVNALLYWACVGAPQSQITMYSGIDPSTESLTTPLCAEAERHWNQEREDQRDTILNMAAAEFLSLGYLGQGIDHKMLVYVSEATEMGIRLGLFGVPTQGSVDINGALPVQENAARAYAAWGVFNWITLMSLFYQQPGLKCPKYPPLLPIPEDQQDENMADGLSTSTGPDSHRILFTPWYMGQTFSHLCRFWRIMHEVCLVYYSDGEPTWGSLGHLPFAEFKYRELLAWSNSLPEEFTQKDDSPHHVQILHLWFHAAILDVFRPFIKEGADNRLRTFSHPGSTIGAVYAASVAQLMRLIFNYRSKYSSSSYSILWHTALMYVANAKLGNVVDDNWYSWLLLCIYGYESLGRSWRVAGAITKALLSMTLRKRDISSEAARRILRDLEGRNWDRIPGGIRATFMADLDLALSDPRSATVEYLAAQFEENAMLRDYTNILDDE